MKKAVMVLAALCLLAMPAISQENYKAEIFGGYQYTRLSGTNMNGWNASVTGNVNNWFGITGDISGAYKSESGASLNLYNFLFGPTVSYNKAKKVKPFAHALFGVSHASVSSGVVTIAFPISGGSLTFSGSDNAFAMALGGGVDVAATKSIAIRVIQADYFMTRFSGDTQNNARVSTGVVFRF